MHKTLQRLSLATLAICLGLLVYAVFSNNHPGTIFFADDSAFALSLGRIVLDGNLILTGLPSHLGGRHIGPFYLWLVAVVTFLSGSKAYLSILFFSIFKVLATVVLFSFVFKLLAPRKYLIPGLFFVFAAIVGSDSLVNYRILWVNNLIPIFVLLQLIALYYVFKSGIRALAAFILSSSLLIQIHLMTAPVILATWICALVSLKFKKHKEEPSALSSKLAITLSLIFSFLLWLAPTVYEIFYQSNVRKLFLVHIEKEHLGVGIIAALKLLYKFFNHYLFGQVFYHAAAKEGSIYPLIFAVIIFLVSVGAIIRFLKLRDSAAWLGMAIVFSLLMSILSIAGLKGPLHHYYYNSFLFLPPIALGLTVTGLCELAETTGPKKILSLILITGVFVFYCLSIPKNLEYYAGPMFEPTSTLKHAQEIAAVIEKDRAGEKNVRLLVHERRRHRKNAIYHLLDGQYFRRMQYSGYFKELTYKPEFTREVPKLLYLLSCPKPGPTKEQKTLDNFSKDWSREYKISLECSTCGECELSRFSRK